MNKNITYRITKNFSSLIAAQVVYKLIMLIMMIWIARFLGAQGFGQISYGLSFVWVFIFLSDFGFSELFIRDVVSKKNLFEKYINNIVTLKIFVSLVFYSIIILLGWRFSFGIEKFWIISILGLSVILDSFVYFFRSLFRVKETMGYEAILMVIEGVLKIGMVFLAIKSKFDLHGAILIAIALLIVSIVNFLINFVIFIFNYKKSSFTFSSDLWRYLLANSFPFALGYILALINFRVDVIMLSVMEGDVAAGWYNADYKLLEQFFIIPITLSYVFLPVFSKLSKSYDNLQKIFKRAVTTLFIFGFGGVGLCYLFGDKAIELIYGREFENAKNYFFILSLVLPIFFIKPIIEKFLYGLEKQLIVCGLYLAGVICNIILNLIMIPQLGINGASIATVISEILTTGLLFYFGRTLISSVQKKKVIEHKIPVMSDLI
ncbi:MAG: flippase [Thermodesulfobacteriota bacterium]